MKKKKMKLSISLGLLIIGFLISTSILKINSTKALVEGEYDQYTIDSFDRFTWKWSITEVVSTESTGNSVEPSLAVDAAGNVHIAWIDSTDYAGSGTDYDIFYKYWDASSSSWTTAEVVSTESTGESYLPSLAVDAAGNVHIAWTDVTDYAGAGTDWDIFYKRWVSSSSAWTTAEVVSTESTGNSDNPYLAVDAAGNVHITWEDSTDYAGSGTDIDIFYKYWDMSTSLWTTTEVVFTESTSTSYQPSLAVDAAGDVHIACLDYTDYAGSGTDMDIFYKYWDASSSSWTTAEVVSTESTDTSSHPSLAVDVAGNVHIAWEDVTDYASAGIDDDIFYKRWEISTFSWTTTEVVSTGSTADSSQPSLAVDAAGDVHIAWYEFTDYAGSGWDWDIFYNRWDASTSLWTTTEVVSTESTDDSSQPSLAVDAAGNVHVAWTDVTDYVGAETDWDIFYKQFAGSPASPDLAFIVPNPIELATIYLDWN
ncbi:MAG: hypothetical protein KAU62_15170, partial [Candidatus Heimdallarchaeota archaeon]|nr:hypothetical protein [Candidatus Heimdallarchaeota archaeon]MCK4612495.1 hypothetical protein [Candidatus Heimdallarchaeota archaeon]